jgi:hypothetical protein
MPWLALPTSSDVLATSKDTGAIDPREKNQLSEEATREGTGKKWAKKKKELAKLGKKCAPDGVMVVVVGSLPGRSPATRPDTTSLPGKGNPGKGCGNELKGK